MRLFVKALFRMGVEGMSSDIDKRLGAFLVLVVVMAGGWGCAAQQERESSKLQGTPVSAGEERSERIEDPEGLMRRYRGDTVRVELSEEEIMESGGVPASSILLNDERYEELLSGEARRIIFVGSPSCSGARWLAPMFEEVMQNFGVAPTYSIAAGHSSRALLDEMPIYRVGYPMLIVIDGDRVGDIQNGGERNEELTLRGFYYLLVRNGFVDGEVGILTEYGSRTDEQLRHSLRNYVHHHHANFDDQNLREVDVQNASFAGSTFRNADLRGANFQGAFLTYVDLRGARIEGADFSNVFWSNAICPDGSNSDENNQSCEGAYHED